MVRADYKPSLSPKGDQSRFLDVEFKASSDGVREGSGNLMQVLG